jgi:hypothetical protein
MYEKASCFFFLLGEHLNTRVSIRTQSRSLAVAWQSGEPGHPTQNDVIPSISLRQIPKKSNYSSPIANILHTYTGKIMLSFCPDMASSTDPSPMIIPYRTTLQKVSRSHYHLIRDNLTENSSTNPQTRSAHANATTEIVKPALPSKVLGVVGDHLYRPTLFPTTDAWALVISHLLL